MNDQLIAPDTADEVRKKQQEDIMWNAMISMIKSEKYILVIGPEVFYPNNESSLFADLKNHLQASGLPDISYYEEEEFFSFKTDLPRFVIQQFFAQQPMPEVYRKIAQIPFHCVISLSPDLLLQKAFEKEEYNVQFRYYNKNGGIEGIARPTPQQPLIYNLVGSVDDDQSLVFTYDDLFEYLISISGGNMLPNELRTMLNTTKNFIFLGFKFDKWYLKLLFRLLRLHENKQVEAYCRKNSILPYVQEFFQDLFKFKFIEEEENVGQFIDRLHAECVKKNALRHQLQPPGDNVQQVVNQNVAKNEILEAISYLRKKFNYSQTDELKESYMLEQAYTKAVGDHNTNQIDRDRFTQEVARVSKGVLELAQRIA